MQMDIVAPNTDGGVEGEIMIHCNKKDNVNAPYPEKLASLLISPNDIAKKHGLSLVLVGLRKRR